MECETHDDRIYLVVSGLQRQRGGGVIQSLTTQMMFMGAAAAAVVPQDRDQCQWAMWP